MTLTVIDANVRASLPIFIPLNSTTIRWNEFIASKANNTHVTRAVERDNVKSSEDVAFLKTIINLKRQDVNLYKSDGLEKHLFYMFLIGNIDHCSIATRFLECNIDISDLGSVCLCSSILTNWVQFVTKYSNLDSEFNLRFVANCVHFHLNHLGFEPLFSKWGREICHDGTTVLIPL